MLVVYNSSKRACDKCLQSVLFLLLVFSFVLPNVDIKSKVGLLFFFQCFLFSPQLVDKTITKVIVLVCVCKSSQLLPVSIRLIKDLQGGAFYVLAFPAGRESATFWDKGTEVSSLSPGQRDNRKS